MKITDYICPKSMDLYVQGNNYSNNYTYFEISFKKCSGTDSKGNSCQDDKDITKALNEASITIAIVFLLLY